MREAYAKIRRFDDAISKTKKALDAYFGILPVRKDVSGDHAHNWFLWYAHVFYREIIE